LCEQFIDRRLPCCSFVFIKVAHWCREDRPRIGARSRMIGRGTDCCADPVDDRFQFRVGGQESQSDSPRPLLGHAVETTHDSDLDQLTLMPRSGRSPDAAGNSA
jgi:hypothetical protein